MRYERSRSLPRNGIPVPSKRGVSPARKLAAASRSRDVAPQGRGRNRCPLDAARCCTTCRRTRSHGTSRQRQPAAGALRIAEPAQLDTSFFDSSFAGKLEGTGISLWNIADIPEEAANKLASIAFATVLIFCGGFAYAQSGGSGRGSTSGDPAASSASPGTSPTTGSSMKPSRSRSGSSTSGGSDANGDQGRDKMPDSSQGVRPLNKQGKPDRM